MDRVVFGGCLLLVVFGILLGLGVGSTEVSANKIRGVFELLSFAGTAATAIVAVAALTSWQSQFRHSEKFKVLKDFQSTLDDGESASVYVMALFRVFVELHESSASVEITDLFNKIQRPQKVWLGHCAKVDKSWQGMLLHFDQSEISMFSFTHRDLEELVQIEVQKIIRLGFVLSDPDLSGMYEVSERCVNTAKNKSRTLYSESNVLLKRLVG